MRLLLVAGTGNVWLVYSLVTSCVQSGRQVASIPMWQSMGRDVEIALPLVPSLQPCIG